MNHARVALCLLMGFGFVSTAASQEPASAPPELLDQLVRAEAKWQASKTEAYEFRFQYACNGLIPPPPPDVQPGRLIRVKDGEITYLETPGAVPVPVAADLVQYSTIEKLFAFIRKAWAARPSDPQPGDLRQIFPRFLMDVQYDPARGYPTRLCVDPSGPLLSDDEFGFLVTDFKVLSNAAELKR
jgi:hypothetical protein